MFRNAFSAGALVALALLGAPAQAQAPRLVPGGTPLSGATLSVDRGAQAWRICHQDARGHCGVVATQDPVTGAVVIPPELSPYQAVLSPQALARNVQVAVFASQAQAISRTIDAKVRDGCVALADISAPSSLSEGAANAARIKAAYLQAGLSGKGCVDLNPAVDANSNPIPIVTDPIELSEYDNVAFNCSAPGKVQGRGSTKLQASGVGDNVFSVLNRAGMSWRKCGWVSSAKQTAGAYIRLIGANTITCEDCSMDRGWVPIFVSNSGGIYLIRPNIRNSQFRGMWFTGTAGDPNGGAHDVFIDMPQLDIDDDSVSPNVDAGIYIDYSGGAIFAVGGDVLHHHNNYWINPGAGQFAEWEYTVGTAFDYPDFDTNVRGGTSVAITPHDGAVASGNVFDSIWAATASPGVKVVGDAKSTCAGNVFTGLQALHNRRQAFLTDYCENTVLAFPMMSNESIASPGSDSALEVGAHTKSMQVLGGYIGSQGSSSPATQKFNLQIDSGFAGLFTMVGTNLVPADKGQGYIGPTYWDLVASHPAIGSKISDSPGVNPQGVGTITCAASPCTYQAGYTKELLNLVGGVVSSVTITDGVGNTIPWAISTNVAVPLAPAQSATITYSTAPTIRVQRD